MGTIRLRGAVTCASSSRCNRQPPLQLVVTAHVRGDRKAVSASARAFVAPPRDVRHRSSASATRARSLGELVADVRLRQMRSEYGLRIAQFAVIVLAAFCAGAAVVLAVLWSRACLMTCIARDGGRNAARSTDLRFSFYGLHRRRGRAVSVTSRGWRGQIDQQFGRL